MFSEDVANFLQQFIGKVPYLVLAFALFPVGPILLWIAFAKFQARRQRHGWDGLLLGAIIAAWASLCWLVVPYCGGYPCLPALFGLSLMTLLGASPDPVTKEFVVHATNFLVWPGLGWALFAFAPCGHDPGNSKSQAARVSGDG